MTATTSIKQSETVFLSHVRPTEDILPTDPKCKADVLEELMTSLYKTDSAFEREQILSTILALVSDGADVADQLTSVAYAVCDESFAIRYLNDVFVNRSQIKREDFIGRPLINEEAYKGSQTEMLYTMVMRTRLVGSAFMRYVRMGFDGWFVIVVVPLADGGIGILSRYADDRSELAL